MRENREVPPSEQPRPSSLGGALHDVTLRAFDVSEHAARVGLASQRRRVERWRSRVFMICQTSFTAGTAWFLGQHLLGHPMPFFASVAAIICLGFSFGQRTSRVLQVAVGVFLGVLVGDIFVRLFGTGPLQIMLVCFVAMSIATWINGQVLFINQSGIQAATVMTLMPAPGQGISRWEDALLGCGLALLMALVAPTSPVQRPRQRAAQVLRECSASVRAAHQALRDGDQEQAEAALERARATEKPLSALREATGEGIAVARYSPFLHGHREHVQAIGDLVAPLDRLVRNLRVLARRAVVASWRGDDVPEDYLALLPGLADVIDMCAQEMDARRTPERARSRMVFLAEQSAAVTMHGSLSAVVLLAQVRSMLTDLMELTGLDYADARELLPDLQ
ncbi:hypothetical protein GCM10009638_20380 [Luteococcus sanguinis]